MMDIKSYLNKTLKNKEFLIVEYMLSPRKKLLFGQGMQAQNCYEIFSKYEIDISGTVCTNPNSTGSFLSKTISRYAINAFPFNKSEYDVLISVNEKNNNEIKKILHDAGFPNIYYSENWKKTNDILTTCFIDYCLSYGMGRPNGLYDSEGIRFCYKDYSSIPLQKTCDPVNSSEIIDLVFQISDNCNLRCDFCWVRKFSGKKIDLETVKKVVSFFINNNISANTVRLDGNAEAFTYGNGIEEIIFELKKITSYIYTITNGVLLTPVLSEKIIKAGIDMVDVSFTGPNPVIYKKFQGGGRDLSHVKQQLETVTTNIENFLELKNKLRKKVMLQLNYILTRETLPYALEFADYFHRIGVSRISFQKLMGIVAEENKQIQKQKKSGEAVNNEHKISAIPPPPDKSESINVAYQSTKNLIIKSGKLFMEGKKNLCGMIGLNKISPIILANGDVYPCCATNNSELLLGNIYEKPLQEVLFGKKASLIKKAIYDINNLPISCLLCGTKFNLYI
jgi:radical SAM protein with 4Fe4S-binding SPASM domain